jgi:hypothetical protein
MDREAALLEFYRDSAVRLRAEAAKFLASPAENLDAELVVEPSPGLEGFSDRVRNLRASFLNHFPQHVYNVPSLEYRPTRNNSLSREDLRALAADLDRFTEFVSTARPEIADRISRDVDAARAALKPHRPAQT